MGTPTEIWFEQGTDQDFAFVFGCPGWAEEFNPRPAAAQTGHNLEMLLGFLRQWNVPVPTREDLTITNAWDRVMYEEKDGHSTPDIGKVTSDKNIARLYNEIGSTKKWIVCFGKHAQAAGKKLKARLVHKDCRIVKVRHLSLQSLNRAIHNDLRGKPIPDSKTIKDRRRAERKAGGDPAKIRSATLLRMEYVAAELAKELGYEDYLPPHYVLRQPKRGGRTRT